MFLRAMAELGTGPYLTDDVADKLKVKISTLAFRVTLFDEFMRRAI